MLALLAAVFLAIGIVVRQRATMDVPISLAILPSAAMSLVQTMRGGHEVYFDACV